MTVLIAAASLSIAAQLAVAKPGPTGWLLAAVPALAFLALSKLVLSRTTPTQPASVLDIEHPTRADTATATADLPALEADHHALADNPAEPVPAHLMTSARMAAFTHQQNTGRPITTDGLAEHLGITTGQAAVLLRDLQAPTTPTASQHEGTACDSLSGVRFDAGSRARNRFPGSGHGANTEPTTFYLGTPMPKWLENATAPLFISDRRLRHRKTFPQAATRWALDSGGFQELKDNGRWTITPAQYIDHIRRYRDQIGKLDWAAPMDWMCEPAVIHGGTLAGQHFVGTHLSVLEHQRRTVENYFHLRDLAPDLPIIPVLQGWTLVDYLTCVDLYDDAGIDLTALPLVGLGSVCRRQSTTEIEQIVTTLAGLGIRLHGFGVKTRGLDRYGHLLTSADSMAWSAEARWLQQPLPGCTGHKNCANCPRYAYQWHQRILDKLSGPTQLQISAPAPTRTRRAQSTRPAPLPSTGRSVFANDTALERAGDGYFDWLDHVWPAAGCSHPIRLFGDLDVVDNRTGELTRTLSTAAMPDGVIYKACGTAVPPSAPPAPTPTAATPSNSSAPAWPEERPCPSRSAHIRRCSLPSPPHPSVRFTPVASAATPAPTKRAAAAAPIPAMHAATCPAASTVTRSPASPIMSPVKTSSGSRCVRTATTTTITPSGTTTRANCGDAPNKPSPATSTAWLALGA